MEIILTIGLDALCYILTLLLVSIGLVIIFGLMNVVNMAHGEFFLLGAYSVVLVQKFGGPFWLAMIVGFVAVAIVGLIVEVLVVSRIYHRALDTILATWGVSLVIKQAIIIFFGPASQQVVTPFQAPAHFFGLVYPSYRLFIMLISVMISLCTFIILYRTNLGLMVRGVIANRHMSGCLGLNTQRIDRLTFALGSGLAGLAGVIMAPLMSVDPQMGLGFFLPGFLSVLVGGAGSPLGALWGAGLVGGGTSIIAAIKTPVVSQIIVFSMAMVVIRIFPNGILGRNR
ncbi:MAG: branched-chain amino acid ABC transporter permease [Deltaproteobacteria bacterium]|jgi:branched-chain amino acid transport system permease protein/urea transport system permease protein|nr:branched-chain amino acid ABC transporter permease [Deltaproteobacteria bacterium]